VARAARDGLRRAALAAAAAVCAAPALAQTAITTLTPNIGSSTSSAAFGVSDDGARVAGVNFDTSGIAAIWVGGAWSSLGVVGGYSSAFGISGSGNVIVGNFGATSPGTQVFKWTFTGPGPGQGTLFTVPNFLAAAGPMRVSFDAAGTFVASQPLSRDGTTVVGYGLPQVDGFQAWRCVAACAVPQGLGWLDTAFGTRASAALGVNADGSAVVGQSTVTSSTVLAAFYWSAASGMVNMGRPAGMTGDARAMAINDAGTVATGGVRPSNGIGVLEQAVVWNITPGVAPTFAATNIQNLTGVTASRGHAISADGTIAVGSWTGLVGGQNAGAFRWTSATGMQDIRGLLTAAGVSMTGISLTGATGISADGQFVTANGSVGAAGRGFLIRFVTAAPPPAATTTTDTTPPPVVVVAGITNPASVIQSGQTLAESRQTQMVTNRVLTSVLQGVNEQVNCSAPCVSGFGSFGSFSAGFHGRREIVNDWTVVGGLAFARSERDGVEVRNSVLGALALRFDPADWGPSRPYAEFGGTISPWQQVRYGRRYQNGAGWATGSADTEVTNAAVFGRLGWVHRPTPIDEFGASIELWHGRQFVRGYTEGLSPANPFNASVHSGTDVMNVVRVGGQWSRLAFEWIELNVNGGVARSFGSRSGTALSVAGVGQLRPELGEATWGEIGGRVGFRIGHQSVIDVFANGTVGPKPIGNSVHVGGGLRINF
jgi:uncharacterized membrane protein